MCDPSSTVDGVADPIVRILIAADCPLLRSGIRNVLECEADFRLAGEASTLSEAIQRTHDRAVDVLLLDAEPSAAAVLPVLDAVADVPGVRVILLAGRPSAGDEVAALARGARGVFSKESATALLPRSIRAVVGGEYWIGRDATGELIRRSIRAGDGPAKRVQAAARVRLTPRELDVIGAVVEGCSNRDIAERFMLSGDTIKHHLTSIFDKTGTGTRLELALFAIDRGLVRTGSADVA
jgi:two-component system, NarL family, nitrate/nitrite response regulator NarL